jgi:histidinol-phosphate aminotransferase
MKNLRLNPHLLSVPPYIGGKPIEEVQEEYNLTDVIKLGSNESPLGPSPFAVAAFQEALKNGHRYPGIADKHLREKLARHYNARAGTSLTEHQFITGNGLTDVIRMIIESFIFDGGESLYCSPTFPIYSILTKAQGGIATAVPHDHYHYNLSALATAINPNTRLVFICNPNNPTGTLVTRQEVQSFMARVPSSAVVVFDESYYDFVQDPDYANSLDYLQTGQDNVLVLRGFSKSYGMANLRIGYAIGTPAMIEYLRHAQLVFNTGDATLHAAMAALDDDAYLQAVRKLIWSEKEFLYRGLADLDLNYIPTQSNFILLVNLPRDVKMINERMLRQGVIIRPMGGFGMPDAIRVTIGTHAENERLLDSLRQVLA